MRPAKVAKTIRQMKVIKDECKEGEEAICRKLFKTNEGNCNVRFNCNVLDL